MSPPHFIQNRDCHNYKVSDFSGILIANMDNYFLSYPVTRTNVKRYKVDFANSWNNNFVCLVCCFETKTVIPPEIIWMIFVLLWLTEF